MGSEPHVRGTEFGELQLAIWRKQFEALRDGDRFFYLNDPVLDQIRLQYGIDYRQTLANVIELNTAVDVQPNVFVTEVPAAADTTSPNVSITAPAAGATVSGTIIVSATASDNVGVAGVQFTLDGANLGAEDTSAPYSVAWNTTNLANGSHVLTAVARDAAGNVATSTPVTVTVANAVSPSVLFGDQQVESFVDSNAPGLAEAFQTVASASGTLRSISVYVDATSASKLLQVGLYTEGATGHPSLLLAHGALRNPVVGAWNTVILNPVAVTAGKHYWIALLDPIGTLRFRDRCCGGVGDAPSETSAQTSLATLPDIWATGTA